MKPNLLFKVLTTVIFLLTGAVQAADAPVAAVPPAAAAGAPAPSFGVQQPDVCLELTKSLNTKAITQEQYDDMWVSRKCVGDAVTSCKEAKKDLSEKEAKKNAVCSVGLNQSSGAGTSRNSKVSCDQKYLDCKAQITGLFTPSADGADKNEETSLGAVSKVANAFITAKLGGAAASAAPNTSCIQEFDSKVVRDNAKEIAREKKELEKEIKKEIEEQNKLNKKLREKGDEIQEEQTKLETENTKENAALDKETTKETQRLSKATADSAKRLRQINLQITNEQQNQAKSNFDYQTAMLDLTDDRVKSSCKQQFETLKAGIVKARLGSAPANMSADKKAEYDQLTALAAQYQAKGISGSGQLSVMLKQANDACFQKAQTSRNKNKMLNTQAIKNSDDKLAEFKKQISDENAALATTAAEIKTAQDQATTDKNNANAKKLKELSNLNTKLSNFNKSTEEEIALSKKNQEKITDDIKALVLKTNLDATAPLADAGKVLSDYETARQDTVASCCPANPKPADKAMCSRLKDKANVIDDTKKAKNPYGTTQSAN